MKEIEAKTKWCPYNLDQTCIASDCMMWVEHDNECYPSTTGLTTAEMDADFAAYKELLINAGRSHAILIKTKGDEQEEYYPAGDCGLKRGSM